MTITFDRCQLRYAGLLQDQNGYAAIIPTEGNDVVSVTADTRVGTWSTAAVKLRYANARTGPWQDYSTPITIGSSSKTSNAAGVFAEFIALEITTGEGSDLLATFSVTLSRSGIATQAAL